MNANNSRPSTAAVEDVTILSIVCKGVDLSSTSPLLNSGFLARVTGGSIPRNVKKLIRVQKSEPFPPGGRPPSMLYDTIYESEPFEDVAIIMPSLLVEIRNPPDKDCKIRVNVYYNSSLTNGKDILLVATTFNFKEMIRCKAPIFTSQMVSEHCSQALAYIRWLTPLPSVLHTKSIQSTSSATSKWNPMFQRYVFHSDHEKNQPVICEEFTWEPRLTTNVSYKYLLNLSKILTETLTAWKVRSELERVRQGKFISREEAFLNGWYELSISPSSCLLNGAAVSPASNSVDEEYLSSSPSVSVSGEDKNSFLNRVRIGSDETLSSAIGEALPPSHRLSTNGQQQIRTTKKLSNTGIKQPSCYVEVSIEHSDLLFSLPVGRTNTEYSTLAPCFGSNVNPRATLRNTAEFQLSPLADPDNVQITRIPFEHVLEDLMAGPDSRTVKYGTRSCFHVFVPYASGLRIRCDLYAEDVSTNNGKGTLIGTCYHNLNGSVKDESRPTNLTNELKIPIPIKNPGADPKWQLIDAELSLGLSLQQQPQQRQQQQEQLPAVSPHINSFYFGDYNERSLGTSCLSKSLGLFGENEMAQEMDAVVDKISLDRFSDSDDEDDDDSEGEFSSPIIKSSHPSQHQSPEIVSSTFPESLEKAILTAKEEAKTPPSSRLRSFSATNQNPRDLRQASLHSAEILGECYEWMWHVGFKGMDPLGLPSLNADRKSSQGLPSSSISFPSSLPPPPHPLAGEYLPRVDIPYSLIWMNEHITRLEFILCQIKYLVATYYEDIALNKSFRPSKLKKEIEVQALPINLHIQNMVVQKYQHSTYDPSNSATTSAAANGGGVTNGLKKSDESNGSTVHVIDSITCGAMACHGLGYSQGGLHNIETTLQRSKANLESLKKQYTNDLHCSPSSLSKLSPTPSADSSSPSISPPPPPPPATFSSPSCAPAAAAPAVPSPFHYKSREYEFREFLSTSIFNYENSTTSIILRRIYSLSQILSIAINSFLYKLELVVEGQISSYFLERWYVNGFLILFECLLSVNGKERAMLEDTRTAIDMIQLYHIRLLPSPTQEFNHSQSSHKWYREQYQNQQRATQQPRPTQQHTQQQQQPSKWLDTISTERADVHIIGREILLFIPEEGGALEALPEAIRSAIMSTGAMFHFKAALFSQGIDIMQSMTNAWDSHESGLSSRDLQYQINLQGLQQLNTYCELVQPVQTLATSLSSSAATAAGDTFPTRPLSPPMSSPPPGGGAGGGGVTGGGINGSSGHLYSGLTQEAHPLTDILSTIIYRTNINEKNVEMLIEVERIGRILGACRVTFCKSGKDRTGMAITLEQSRLLGENFDCGQSFERIIRDANMMRQYGTRLMVAEKNIGKAIYAINRLQIKFLPLFYRPPIQLTEDLMKKSDNS